MTSPERWTRSTVYADMWVDPDDDPREASIDTGDERGNLLDFLRRYRLTFEMKCSDLDAEQLARRSVPPSSMSLLGMLRHLTEVEQYWFRKILAGQDIRRPYSSKDDPDGDWDGAVADPAVVAEAWQRWRAEVAFADELMANVVEMAANDPDAVPPRRVLVHMIEEYARHCGHADLLRERIDGRVGQ